MKSLISRLLVICLASAVSASYAQTDNRILATWQVQRYELAVVSPQTDADRILNIRAKLDLKNVSTSAASSVTLRISPAAEISAVRVGGAQLDFTKAEERSGSVNLQKFAVRINSVPPGSSILIEVDYRLAVRDNTGVASVSVGRLQLLPLSFWYPTPNSWFFARGADFAPFTVSVSGAAGQTVVPNGAQKLAGQPFVLTGTWESSNRDGIETLGPKGSLRATDLAQLAADARAFMTGFFGSSAPAQIQLAAVRRGAGFAGGGTLLIDEGVFRRSSIDSQTGMSIAEGIAKMWLGGSVAITGGGDGAVREGLSRFLATQFIESKYGRDVADVERAKQRSSYAAVAARDAPVTVVTPLDEYYFSVTANKGAMIWRLLERQVGRDVFKAGVKSALSDGEISLAELRQTFESAKVLLDYGFDNLTETNLQAGLPLAAGGSARAALRNTGPLDVSVNVEAELASGKTITVTAPVAAKSFGEASFATGEKIVRVEIDPEKYYPQTDYSDDVAPRECGESDALLCVKRLFDKQEFTAAEKAARSVLRRLPRFDEVRVLLGRALLASGRTSDAEIEFRAVLAEKLPSVRGIAWANVGLAEVAFKKGQAAEAGKFAADAILADADYGAGLAAREVRRKLSLPRTPMPAIADFFSRFDSAATGNKKAELENLIVPGEVAKFASGIAGQTESWKTELIGVDALSPDVVLAETETTVKLLNRDPSSGTAVYRLINTASGWKLAAVEIFEVR